MERARSDSGRGRSGKELLIVVPAYNEERNIEQVLSLLDAPEIQSIADVLVVNDGSTDRTGSLARRHSCALVEHIYNLGYGCALQTGYRFADRNRYSYVIQMDADGQHDVCNIYSLYDRLRQTDGSGPDMVLASRFLPGSECYPVPAAKRLAFVLFRGMIRLFTGQRITDPTTGLQGLNRRTVHYFAQYGNFDDRTPDANIIVKMLLLGCEVVEIPAVMHERSYGSGMYSGLKPVNYMFRMFFSVLANAFQYGVLTRGGIDDVPGGS